jgi:hypothetical protein
MLNWIISGAAGLARAATSISTKTFRSGGRAAVQLGRGLRRGRRLRKARKTRRLRSAARSASRQGMSRASSTIAGRNVRQNSFLTTTNNARRNPTGQNIQNAAQQANATYARSQNERAAASERAASTMYALANAASVVTVGFMKIPLAIAVLVRGIHLWGDALLNQQRGTAQYSAQMSYSAATLDVARVLREMRQARSTESSFSQLAASINRLEEAMAPFRALWTNGMNMLASRAADIGSDFLKFLTTPGNIQTGIPSVDIWWNQLMKAYQNNQQQNQASIMGPLVQFGQLRDQQRAQYIANQGSPNIPKRPKKPMTTSGGGGVTQHGN